MTIDLDRMRDAAPELYEVLKQFMAATSGGFSPTELANARIHGATVLAKVDGQP